MDRLSITDHPCRRHVCCIAFIDVKLYLKANEIPPVLKTTVFLHIKMFKKNLRDNINEKLGIDIERLFFSFNFFFTLKVGTVYYTVRYVMRFI